MPKKTTSKKRTGRKKTGKKKSARKKLSAEAIGRVLWAEFRKTAAPKTVGPSVIRRGRRLSGGPIRRNAAGNFPMRITKRCARRCGTLAKQYSDASPSITVDAFQEAWYKVRDQHRKALQKWAAQHPGANLGFAGGAC